MPRNRWKWLSWLASPKNAQSKSPQRPRRRSLRCELLEDRQLLSAVVVNGTNGPDSITANWVDRQLQVAVNGVIAKYSNASGLTVNGLGGSDTIEIKNLPFGATVYGGEGNDTIKARNGQADTLVGGAGYDTVIIESYDVAQQVECVNPYTSATDNQPMHVKVLVMNFAPHVQSQGNQLVWQAFGWTDPRILAADYEATIERTSGGLVKMDIVDWVDVNSLVPRADGYVYSGDEYYNIWSTTRTFHQPDTADNAKLMNDYEVPQRVASGEIDEVWVFGPPGAGADWEASMLGPRSFFINGGVYPNVDSQRPFAMYGFNYERGVDCMTENTLHRMENHMARSYGGWNLAAPQTNWDRFTANIAQSPITPGVGSCHYGPNSASDYDWANPRYVTSNADDWLNYPNLTGRTRQISYAAWTNGGTRDSFLGHHNWWLEHLPRAPGVNADGRQNNWWKYAYDYDNYDANTGKPKPFRAESTLADVTALGDTFYDFDVRFADPLPIDVTSLGDGDIVVRGPGGFSQVAHLMGVSDTSNGTFRVGHYRITPPGGSWDYADSGYYSVSLQGEQVRDTAGYTLAGQTLGYFRVGGPMDQLSEKNAGAWTAWAEYASASVVDDYAVKCVGNSSLKFTTDGGFDTRLKYELSAGQVWDLRDVPAMSISLRAEDPYGFQNSSPWIRVVDSKGGYYQYQYYRFGASYDLLNDVRGNWQSFLIPLNPGTPDDGWHRTAVNSPDMSDICSLEIHADTWDSGFTLWIDGLGFAPPTPASLPAAPTLLTAVAASRSQINLSWTDNASNEDGFKIERSLDGVNGWTQVGKVAANLTTYSAKGLSESTKYFFRVCAYNADGDSGYTDSVAATTLVAVPAAPSGLKAAVVSASQINLMWKDNATTETGYRVDRANNSTFTTGLVSKTLGANARSFKATGLWANTKYYFRVVATSGTIASGASNVVGAKTWVAPAAPTQLTARAASASQINLAWKDNASTETGYRVDWATNSTFTAGLVSKRLGANVRTVSATGLLHNRKYYFRVVAISGAIFSAASNVVSATTKL